MQVLALHIFSCIFWRLKYENDPDELVTFLANHDLSMEVCAYIAYFLCDNVIYRIESSKFQQRDGLGGIEHSKKTKPTILRLSGEAAYSGASLERIVCMCEGGRKAGSEEA